MLLCCAGLLGPGPAVAQFSVPNMGLHLGYSQYGFVGAGATGVQESRGGSVFGIFVDRHLAGPVEAELELQFSKKGGGLSDQAQGVPVSVSVQLVYLELPLLAHIHVPIGGNHIRPFVVGGGSVGFKVGCDFQAEITGRVAQSSCDDPGGVSVAGTDFGAIVGAGFEYSWLSSAVRLEARETFGLRNLVPGPAVKNRGWGILLGITF